MVLAGRARPPGGNQECSRVPIWKSRTARLAAAYSVWPNRRPYRSGPVLRCPRDACRYLQVRDPLLSCRRDRISAILCRVLAFALSAVAWGRTLEFEFDAGGFSAPTSLTNNYWGLRLDSPGPTVYFSKSDDGCELSESEVVGTTGMGFFDDPYDIDAVVVRDREWVSEDCDGEYVLVEDTYDWYAQDDEGNVWYLGEDTIAWDDEEDCLTAAGSWKAGLVGAGPGVVMLGDPRRGVSYQQEYYEDEAEDMAKVLRLDARVSIEYGDYTGCLLTKEYTPLERGQIEHKYYCPVTPGDPGLVLVNEFSGKTKRVEYVGSTRPEGSYPMAFPTGDLCEE